MSSYLRALHDHVAAVYDRRCLLFLSAILLFAAPACAIDTSFPLAWSGATGPSDGFLIPDASRSPVELFEEGLTGRARVLYTVPGKKAPNGAYSASLTLYDNGNVLTVRGAGVPAADGSIDAAWTSSGKTPATVRVTLSRLATNPQANVLQGEATVGSRKYPFFLVPEPYSKTSPYAGTPTIPGPGTYNFFVLDSNATIGSGTGFVTIDAAGMAKFAGTLTDGSKVSLAVPVLVGGGKHFLAVAGLAGKGFLGAWAHGDRTQADSDWHGAAITVPAGKPPIGGLSFLVSPLNPVSTGASPLRWSRGQMFLKYDPYFWVQTGEVGFDGRSRFATVDDTPESFNGAGASNVRLKSLVLDSRKGLVKGAITHFFTPAPNGYSGDNLVTYLLSSTLTGALNQKSGIISGRINTKSAGTSSGFFDIIDAASP